MTNPNLSLKEKRLRLKAIEMARLSVEVEAKEEAAKASEERLEEESQELAKIPSGAFKNLKLKAFEAAKAKVSSKLEVLSGSNPETID